MPRLIFIWYRSLTDLLRPRFLALFLAGPAVVWLISCVYYSRWYPEFQEGPPRFWNLSAVWKESLEQYRQWTEEVGVPMKIIRFSPHVLSDTMKYFLIHSQRIIGCHTRYTSQILPLPFLLIAALILNRLFYQGELQLYLVRPIDAFELLLGRYLALATICGASLVLNRLILLIGAFGEDWRLIMPVMIVAIQTDIALFFGVLAIPFVVAPLAGGLFRGAGAFIISSVVVVAAYFAPNEPTLFKGLIPYRIAATDPIYQKILVVLQNLFTLPIPKIFAANKGLQLYLKEIGGAAGLLNLGVALEDNGGYWWWTFLSGIACLMLALALWRRSEIS